MAMNILIAPSGFKECLDARGVAEAIAAGVRRADPAAAIFKAPIPDGGEGFTSSLVDATGGVLHSAKVTGPVGQQVNASIGFLGGVKPRTAVLEIAGACGLSLVPRDRRDPALTTSFGVGELIIAALDRGAETILIGCGDSGVNDGGAGMIQALGGRLLDRNSNVLGRGALALRDIAGIDLSGLDQRLASVAIDVTVNWHNMLVGERGVSRIYGPQKGATADQVPLLDAALATYADCIARTTGIDVAAMPGGGASGGIGAGLAGLLGAKLHPRYDITLRYVRFDELLRQADLVLTAEGSLDHQTPYGKVPSEVGRRAAALGVPVIALAGTIGEGAPANLAHGVSAYASIMSGPSTLAQAIENVEALLAGAAEQALRMIAAGMAVSKAIAARDADATRTVNDTLISASAG